MLRQKRKVSWGEDAKKVKVSWGRSPFLSQEVVGAPFLHCSDSDRLQRMYDPELNDLFNHKHLAGWDNVDAFKEEDIGTSLTFASAIEKEVTKEVTNQLPTLALAAVGTAAAAAAAAVAGGFPFGIVVAGISMGKYAFSKKQNDLFVDLQLSDEDLHELSPMKVKYTLEHSLLPSMSQYLGMDKDSAMKQLASQIVERQKNFANRALNFLTVDMDCHGSFMHHLIRERCSWSFDSDPSKDTLYMKLVFDMNYESGLHSLDDILDEIAKTMQVPRSCLHVAGTREGSFKIFLRLCGVAVLLFAILAGIALCIWANKGGCCPEGLKISFGAHYHA